MVKIENRCNECSIHCVNCGLKHVKVYYCDEDKCGEELDDDAIYELDGKHYCEYHLLKKFKKEII